MNSLPLLSEIVSYLIPAGGAYAWFAAGRLRKAHIRKADLDADNAWRQFYKDLVSDMKSEISELKQEVLQLKTIVESYKETCNNCPNKNARHE
ncbi:hypothetical protein [uncultured Flavobacterium sp.]|uniref:hypothetical protein n=1 Tax=uncultured Flavobacterium sp. TaxID=165435 RepID=UPI0025E1BFFD|nr:hypothetical protein [uncultured Flavobacterium sp.]